MYCLHKHLTIKCTLNFKSRDCTSFKETKMGRTCVGQKVNERFLYSEDQRHFLFFIRCRYFRLVMFLANTTILSCACLRSSVGRVLDFWDGMSRVRSNIGSCSLWLKCFSLLFQIGTACYLQKSVTSANGSLNEKCRVGMKMVILVIGAK